MLQFIATYRIMMIQDTELIGSVIGMGLKIVYHLLTISFMNHHYLMKEFRFDLIFLSKHFIVQIIVHRRRSDAIRQQRIVFCNGRRHHRIWQPTIMVTLIRRSAMAIQIPWPWWMAIESFNILDWYVSFAVTLARANTTAYWRAMDAPDSLNAAFDENWFIGECVFRFQIHFQCFI